MYYTGRPVVERPGRGPRRKREFKAGDVAANYAGQGNYALPREALSYERGTPVAALRVRVGVAFSISPSHRTLHPTPCIVKVQEGGARPGVERGGF